MSAPTAQHPDTPPHRRGAARVGLIAAAVLPLIIAAVCAAAGIGALRPPTATPEPNNETPATNETTVALHELNQALGRAKVGAAFLNTGLDKAGGGITELSDGSTELASGMKEIQAGTGQLGAGANQLADGVETATGGLSLAAVAAGQVKVAAQRARESLAASDDPNAEAAIADIESLERQLDVADFEAMDTELGKVRNGAREITNQVNGPYSAGVQQATEGSGQLANGLTELEKGHKEIRDKATALSADIAAAQQALSQTNATPDSATAPTDTTDTPGTTFTPGIAAMASLLAVLLLAAVAGWTLWGRGATTADRVGNTVLGVLGISAVGIAALAAVLTTTTASQMAAVALIMLTAAASTALLTAALRAIAGPAAPVIVMAGIIGQAAVVGYAWRLAATDAGSTAWSAAAALLPAHHQAAAMNAVLTGAAADHWAWPLGVLVAVAGCSAAGIVMTGRNRSAQDASAHRYDDEADTEEFEPST
ncbi:hypothetical protein KRX51_00855 [Corynebacterium sp. TAE3-ERU12]|uniref:hypothetical protein n=1 Tax=Corynebacterium sp. TAE3-ERU12 TaxID=2849491 RepID=UPI001C459430|nr:hypothetical protein [Corynebacterium sp. TAE3-ERU12]MBV7294468.1 hypothetical protein [Corynebacterium sp. TAE3-ERU12]